MSEEYGDLLNYNRKAWNAQVREKNRWTIPVSVDQIENARKGQWEIILTPQKPVPRNWFPNFSEQSYKVLCLASGGGQQGPILAAAGADVTVFDNSDEQLNQDRLVAERDGLTIRLEQGDMRDLSRFEDDFFDLIFHPCSNCFVENILPVWNESFRVLKPGGHLLSGFTNPVRYMFDDDLLQQKELEVKFTIPYSDTSSISQEQKEKYIHTNEPCCFGHTLTDQIGGQLDAGFLLVDFFEDSYEDDDELSKYIQTFIATRAMKPRSS